MRAHHRRHRRGASMMLVLVALGTSAVLTTAYLSSRDNSAAIGANVGAGAAARWAATSGVELGIAVTQTETEWRTNHVGGLMIDGLAVGDALVDVTVVDVATGRPPTEKSRDVQIEAVATIGAVRQSASARVSVGTAGGDTPDPDLSDFVIFGKDRIDLTDDATVTRWTTSPLGGEGKTLSLGTHATGSGMVRMTDDSATVDGVLFTGPGVSTTLVQVDAGPSVDQVALADQIPMPLPPDSGYAAPSGPSTNPTMDLLNQTLALSGERRVASATVRGSELQLADGATLVVDEGLQVDALGEILVDGDATLVVFGDVVLDNGQIVLGETGQLTMYVAGALDVQDGYIGDALADGAAPDGTGEATWMDPERLKIYDMSTSASPWSVNRSSVVKASIYSPGSSVDIADSAALYGRVAAREVSVGNSAAVFYDHGLDSGGGYSSDTSLAFDGDGRIQDELKNLVSLNANEVATAASDIETREKGGKVIEPSPPGATPRPVPVEVSWQCIGADPAGWESLVVVAEP